MTDPALIAEVARVADTLYGIGCLLGTCAFWFFVFALFGAFK